MSFSTVTRSDVTSDAGRWIEQEFCRNCGTVLTCTLEFMPEYRGIAGGTFDQPAFWYEPERFVFARTKPHWLQISDGVPGFQTMAPDSSES
jgi:hypothetical protein